MALRRAPDGETERSTGAETLVLVETYGRPEGRSEEECRLFS